jgi:lipopolysaccharide export system permease protein
VEATGDGRFTDNRERTTAELFTLGEEDGLTPRNVRRLRVEGHQRLTNPILNLALTAIALALILTGSFDKHGQLKRITMAILAVILVEAAGLGAASLAAKNLVLVPLIYAVALVPLALGLLALTPGGLRSAVPFSLRPHPGSV